MLVVHMFCTALDNPAPATIVLISGDGTEFVIHAMPMRPTYRKLLEP